MRLLCLPYAGASSAMFHSWDLWLDGIADVCPVRLPGRESRFAEPPFTTVAEAVTSLLEAIRFMHDRPLVLFGYSMGALIAYELARALEAHNQCPNALVIAACSAPHLPRKREPSWNLPAPDFIERLHRLNGTPKEILKDSDAMNTLFPRLRADFRLVETYEHSPGAPLRCPVKAYGGLNDEDAPLEQMEKWAKCTNGNFSLETFPDGHFFIARSSGRMLWSLAHFLAGLLV